MNVIAGALIGYVNSPWIAVLGSSIGWGITYYLYGIIKGKQQEFLSWHYANHSEKKNPRLNFFFIEFMTASSTALGIGSLVYWSKSLF